MNIVMENEDKEIQYRYPSLDSKFIIDVWSDKLETTIPASCSRLKLEDDCYCYDDMKKRPTIYVNLNGLLTWGEVIDAMISINYHHNCTHKYLEGFREGKHKRLYPIWGS